MFHMILFRCDLDFNACVTQTMNYSYSCRAERLRIITISHSFLDFYATRRWRRTPFFVTRRISSHSFATHFRFLLFCLLFLLIVSLSYRLSAFFLYIPSLLFSNDKRRDVLVNEPSHKFSSYFPLLPIRTYRSPLFFRDPFLHVIFVLFFIYIHALSVYFSVVYCCQYFRFDNVHFICVITCLLTT